MKKELENVTEFYIYDTDCIDTEGPILDPSKSEKRGKELTDLFNDIQNYPKNED